MKNRFGERGSAVLELVFVLPVLFVMIMAVLQFAHIWMARQVVKYAAYCAARSTLTANQMTAHAHARKAAGLVCAWITFSVEAEDLKTISSQSNYSFGWNSQQVNVDEEDLYVRKINYIGFDYNSAENIINKEVKIHGWGYIPNSSSLDNRLRVWAGIKEPLNYIYPWETRATVEFDFPLLMPVVGKMLSYLVNKNYDDLKTLINSDQLGFDVGSWWTGQKEVIETDKAAYDHAYPYITLKEVCILPKPYSTSTYPLTSADFDIGVSGLLQGGNL